jgi:hypothetical protein
MKKFLGLHEKIPGDAKKIPGVARKTPFFPPSFIACG